MKYENGDTVYFNHHGSMYKGVIIFGYTYEDKGKENNCYLIEKTCLGDIYSRFALLLERDLFKSKAECISKFDKTK